MVVLRQIQSLAQLGSAIHGTETVQNLQDPGTDLLINRNPRLKTVRNLGISSVWKFFWIHECLTLKDWKRQENEHESGRQSNFGTAWP